MAIVPTDYAVFATDAQHAAVRKQKAALEAQIAAIMATAPPTGAIIVNHPDGSQEFVHSQDKTNEQLIEELRANAALAQQPPQYGPSILPDPDPQASFAALNRLVNQQIVAAMGAPAGWIMGRDLPSRDDQPEPETQAEKDARWLRETLEAAGDKTAMVGDPALGCSYTQHGFRTDRPQAEAEAEIAAAQQARIDGRAMYHDRFGFGGGPSAQRSGPSGASKPRVLTPEEVAEAKAAGKFVTPSPVAQWLRPGAAAERQAERERRLAEEARLRATMSEDAWHAAQVFAGSIGIEVTQLMDSFGHHLAQAADQMAEQFRELQAAFGPPAKPTRPGDGLKALRKRTNRKAHWL